MRSARGLRRLVLDHRIRFHQYHLEDMGRLRVRKYGEVEDREVPTDETARATS
jgi:DNA end-binding protein Ku